MTKRSVAMILGLILAVILTEAAFISAAYGDSDSLKFAILHKK